MDLYIEHLKSLSSDYSCNNDPSYELSWTSLGPDDQQHQDHGRIDVVRQDPSNSNVVYAGSHTGGLFRTENKNSPTSIWSNITDNIKMPGIGITDMLIDPSNTNIAYISTAITNWESTLYGGYGVGIFKTTNLQSAQPTWNLITSSPFNYNYTQNYVVDKMYMDNTDPNTIYIILQRHKFSPIYYMYMTTNGGSSWVNLHIPNEVISGPNTTYIKLIDIEQDPLNPNYIYVSGAHKLWRYNKITTVWTDITGNLTGSNVSDNVLLDQTTTGVYVLYTDDGVTTIDKTLDQGNTFTRINTLTTSEVVNPETPVFEVSKCNEQIMYTENPGSFNRVVGKSTNGGNSFTSVTNYEPTNLYYGVSTHADIRGMELVSCVGSPLLSQGDELLVGDDGGVLYTNSVSGGHPVWRNINGQGLVVSQFYGLANSTKDTYHIAGGMQDNGIGVLYSSNWSINTLDGDAYNVAIGQNNTNDVYFEDNGGHLLRSTTYGFPSTSFQFMNAVNPYIPNVSWWKVGAQPLFVDNEDNLFMGYHDVIKSTNQGTSFTQISHINTTHPSDLLQSVVQSSNKNVMYCVYEFPYTWGDNTDKIYKTTNALSANPTWTNITSNMLNSTQAIKWLGATDMAVSPTNSDKVWMTFDGFWENASNTGGYNRVDYSPDGGTTWVDYSKNLPNVPVNCILYEKGSNDGLFIGTDIGVFYTNDNIYPTQGWICVSSNLPYTIVTDLVINYCAMKLRASTFGRGIWEASLPEINNEYHITSNTTYATGSFHAFATNVIVDPGVTLTIHGTVDFAANKSLIIKQGGTVVLDGGTLTNECGEEWGGVQVWGNYSLNQYGYGNQGRLIMENNALIENAYEAVQTWKPNDWNTTGGIVEARNSKILNCRHGVSFMSYHNHYPNTSNEAPNFSHFWKCSFINNAPLQGQPASADHTVEMAALYDVSGINFEGCTFKMENTPTSTPYIGDGIDAADAKFYVSKWLNGPASSFSGFSFAIKAQNGNPDIPVGISSSVFTGNEIGVYLKGINFARVTQNTVNVGGWVNASFFPTVGLYLDHCSAYKVEDNSFTAMNSYLGGYYGLYVYDSGPYSNDIYRNTFTGLKIGSIADGQNSNYKQGGPLSPPIFQNKGLVLNCNTYQNTVQTDMGVPTGGVKLYFGTCTSPANNLFSYTASSGDFWQNNNTAFCYYSFSNSSLTLKPRNSFYNTYNTALHNCASPSFDYSTSCPDSIFTGPIRVSIGTLSAQLSALRTEIDGNHTDSLIDVILNDAAPGQVKNALQAVGPYLSDTVMLTAIDGKPTPLPPGILKNILLPNGPFTNKVYQAIQNRIPALPKGIMKQFKNKQQSGNFSARQLLESDISYYAHRKDLAVNKRIRQYLLDDSNYTEGYDSTIAILKRQDRPKRQCTISCAYLANGQIGMAQQMTDSIHQADSEGKYDDFCRLQALLIAIKRSVSNYDTLATDTSLEAKMTSIANSGTGKLSSVNAQAMLNFVFNDSFPIIFNPLIYVNNQRRSSPDGNNNDSVPTLTNPLQQVQLFDAFPNPTTGQTTIKYSLPKGKEQAKILIVSLATGKLVKSYGLQQRKGSIVIQDKDLATGAYSYSLYVNDNLIATKKLVKVK